MFETVTRRSLLALAMAAGLGTSAPVQAQPAYPTRPVKVVVPFGAGGVADITIRIVAEKLSEKLGQRFIVENMPEPAASRRPVPRSQGLRTDTR
jgi:tripartite-type tricarboxylate transporter receptor subunit TctC